MRKKAPWILALLVAFTSSGVVQKYGGTIGLIAYVGVVIAAFALLIRHGRPLVAWCEKHFCLVAVAVFAMFAVCFAIVYPIEDSRGPGASSDRDQALNISAGRLMAGEYPYYQSEPTAGPLSVLPGSIFLASPFVALGNSAYQNLFWLGAFIVFVAILFADRALALVVIAFSMGMSPSALHEFISGGDLQTNGAFVAVFAILALRAWDDVGTSTAWRYIWMILLGVGLASRPNFLFVLPLFGAALWRETSFLKALTVSGCAFLVFCVVTLPFYLMNPEGFTPLVARAKIAIPGYPWAGAAVVGVTAVVCLISSLSLLRKDKLNAAISFSRCAAYVLITPMVVMVILHSFSTGHLEFGFMLDRFGLMYLPFAWIGWWVGDETAPILGRAEDSPDQLEDNHAA